MKAIRRIACSHRSGWSTGLTTGLLITLLAVGSIPGAVHAGTAPPTRSPGAAISPNPSSAETLDLVGSVSLAAQTVEFVVEAPPTAADSEIETEQVTALVPEQVHARVNGTYVLRNSSRSDLTLSLGFPLNDLSGIKDANGNLPVVEGFGIAVAGAPVDYAQTSRTNPYGEGEPAIQWATFPVLIPARNEVTVGSSFTTTAAGQWPIAQFNYSMETATAWQGRIGQSEIVLRLPYAASNENVFLSESTAGGVIEGDTVRWSRRNLVASAQNNFQMSILAPKVWQQILNARAAAAQTPDNPDVWVTLGRAYRAAIALDNGTPLGGTRQFVEQAEQAYERAIQLNPNIAEVHQEYAQLVYDLRIAEDLNTTRALPQLEKIIDHVQTALQLDPGDPATAELLLNVKQLVQDLAARQPSAEAKALADQITAIEAMVASAPQATSEPAAAPDATTSAPVVTDTISGEATGDVTGTLPLTGTNTTTGTGEINNAQAIPVPTMSAEEEQAVVAAQATVAASAVLTTTPSAPEATAIADAFATVGARETVVANAGAINAAEETSVADATAIATDPSLTEPTVVTVEATAEAAIALGTPVAVETTTSRDIGITEPQTLVARMGLLSIIGIACGAIVILGILAAILIALFGRRNTTRTGTTTNTTTNKPSDGSSGGSPPAAPPASKS